MAVPRRLTRNSVQTRSVRSQPDGGVWQTTYDGGGRVVQEADALGNVTSYEYDVLGQLTKTTDALDHVTEYAYYNDGNLYTTTDALDNVTTYAYDNLGRLTSQTDALAGVTSYTYDANGNVLTLTDPENNTTTWVYDEANRVIQETNQLADSRHFEYDDTGNLIRKTDRDERVTTYEYDHLGRETEENWLDGQSVIATLSYVYDAQGRLYSASDANATYTYTYDTLGRAVSETQTIDGLTPVVTLNSTYDASGQRTRLAALLGSSLDFADNYLYDNLGRIQSIQQHGVGGNAVAEKRVDLTYDAASHYSTITRYADLAGTELVATGDYTFDAVGRLTGLNYHKDTTTLVNYGWSYDAANRMTQYVNSID